MAYIEGFVVPVPADGNDLNPLAHILTSAKLEPAAWAEVRTRLAALRLVWAGEAGHWLGLQLRGTKSGRTPVGARVTSHAGGRALTRWVTTGTSYLTASDPRLWIGLGASQTVEHLEVRWPSGLVQSWSDLRADCLLDLEEGREGVPTR